MSEKKNGVETVLKWIVLVILALAAIKIVLGLLGVAWVLGGFLLFKVLPVVLIVWGVVKLIEWLTTRDEGPADVI